MEWPRSQQLKNQAVMALKTENILKIHKQICQIGKNARSVNWVLYIEYILVLMYQIYQCYVTIIVNKEPIGNHYIKTAVFYKKSCNCQVNYCNFSCMFDTAN